MSSSCQHQDEVSRLLFEELPEKERTELEQHLESCLLCRREWERSRQTLSQLQEWEDVTVPRHFLVSGGSHSSGPYTAFSSLSLFWKGAVAASLILLAGVALAFFSGVHVSAQSGAVTVAWRSDPPPTAQEIIESEPFQRQLTQVLDERLRAESQQLMTQIRTEIEESGSNWSQQQQRAIRAGLANLEQRLQARLEARTLDLENGIEKTNWAVHSLSRRQDQALELLSERIDLIAVSGEIQGSQNDLVLTALMEMADRRLSSRDGS